MPPKYNPSARKTDIVIQEIKDEVLIYDLNVNKAYCLNETAAMIYQMCDGNNSVEEISEQLTKKLKKSVSEDLIWLALDELKKENLLLNSSDIKTGFEGLSRREVIKRVGISSAVALPLIASLVAPTASMAQTGCLGFNQSFTLSSDPFFADAGECVSALQAEAGTRCCSGALNPQMGFEFGTNPQLCRGFCDE